MNPYKDLIVYQKAKTLTIDVLSFFSKSSERDGKCLFIYDQLFRSVGSIGANIVEGYGRYYKKSFRSFLAIARGSSFETGYWLEILVELNIKQKKTLNSFIDRNKQISKMLTALMKKTDTK